MGSRGMRWFAPTLALALALASPARATVMEEVALEDMVQGADAIVWARVVRTGSRLELTGDGIRVHTVSELEVFEWLSGGQEGDAARSAAATRVLVDELGGEVAGHHVAIEGTPEYRVGDEVVAFLRRVDGAFRTLGMVQGLFVVRHGVPGTPDVVVRDLSNVGFAHWDGGPMHVREGGRDQMLLDVFLDWVRGTVDGVRPAPDPGSSGGPGGGGVRGAATTGGAR